MKEAAWLSNGAAVSYALINALPVSYRPLAFPNICTPCLTFCPNDSKKLGLKYCEYAMLYIKLDIK